MGVLVCMTCIRLTFWYCQHGFGLMSDEVCPRDETEAGLLFGLVQRMC